METRSDTTAGSRLKRVKLRGRKAVSIYRRLTLSAQVSFWLVLCLIVVAIAAPILAPYDPAQPHYSASLQGPSERFLLGTDLTGRDILSRLIYGSRVSLMVGIVAVGMAISIGVPMGSVAGYLGGWVDEAIMRANDVLMSFPVLITALALVGALGPSLRNVILVMGIAYSPAYARLIRGSVLSVKEETYIEAAENTGLGSGSILFKHIVPNAMTPVMVQATFHVATAILFEASLSYLGLGVQPPTPTWGVMISTGQAYLPESWWISTFPGLAIVITVLAFNILGDGLRDELDPRSATQEGTA